MKSEKGVAGLNLFLSLIVTLFVIGLIVMVFSLTGAGLRDATYTDTSGTVTDETLTAVDNVSYTNFAVSSYRNVQCSNIVFYNATGGETITSTNYTVSGCSVIATDSSPYIGEDWKVNYTYTYDADNDATRVIGNTTSSLSKSVEWFDLFIVIAAMVVLILLTVIIIAAIKGSGLITNSQTA